MSIDDFNRYKAEQAERKFNRAQYDEITTEEWIAFAGRLQGEIRAIQDHLDETRAKWEEG